MDAPELFPDAPIDYVVNWLTTYVKERLPTVIEIESGRTLVLGELHYYAHDGWAHIPATESFLVRETGKWRLADLADAAAFRLQAVTPQRTSMRAFLKHDAAADYLTELTDAFAVAYPAAIAGLPPLWAELAELEVPDTPAAIVGWIDRKLPQMYGGQLRSSDGYVRLERVLQHWSPADPFATIRGTYYLNHRLDYDEDGEPPLDKEEEHLLTWLSNTLSPMGPGCSPDDLVRVYLTQRLGKTATIMRLTYPRLDDEFGGKIARELQHALQEECVQPAQGAARDAQRGDPRPTERQLERRSWGHEMEVLTYVPLGPDDLVNWLEDWAGRGNMERIPLPDAAAELRFSPWMEQLPARGLNTRQVCVDLVYAGLEPLRRARTLEDAGRLERKHHHARLLLLRDAYALVVRLDHSTWVLRVDGGCVTGWSRTSVPSVVIQLGLSLGLTAVAVARCVA